MAAREAAMSGAAAVRAGLYNAFMRRTSVYVTVCVAASYATTEAYFGATERIWASINKGKTWPEVQANLPEKTDDDDDDY